MERRRDRAVSSRGGKGHGITVTGRSKLVHLAKFWGGEGGLKVVRVVMTAEIW